MDSQIVRAFALVNPRRLFQEMARRGMVSQEAADRISWRSPISVEVTQAELTEAGLNPDLVAAGIFFMTKSHAHVQRCTVYGTPWMSFWPRSGVPGYCFTAVGAMTPRHAPILTGAKRPY